MLLKMYGVAAALLLIAITCALFGFGAFSEDGPPAALVCAGYFLAIAVLALGWALLNRARRFDGPTARR